MALIRHQFNKIFFYEMKETSVFSFLFQEMEISISLCSFKKRELSSFVGKETSLISSSFKDKQIAFYKMKETSFSFSRFEEKEISILPCLRKRPLLLFLIQGERDVYLVWGDVGEGGLLPLLLPQGEGSILLQGEGNLLLLVLLQYPSTQP